MRRLAAFLLRIALGSPRVLCYLGLHRNQRTARSSIPERTCVRCGNVQVLVRGAGADQWISLRNQGTRGKP